MYGKIINEKLVYAPKEFVEDGKHIRGFTADFLLARGYKLIVWPEEEPPEKFIEKHTETDTQIIISWIEP